MTRVPLLPGDLDTATLDVMEGLLLAHLAGHMPPIILEEGPNGTVFVVEPHTALDLGRCVPVTPTSWHALAYPVSDGVEPWRRCPTLADAIFHVATHCGWPDPTGTALAPKPDPPTEGALGR